MRKISSLKLNLERRLSLNFKMQSSVTINFVDCFDFEVEHIFPKLILVVLFPCP